MFQTRYRVVYAEKVSHTPLEQGWPSGRVVEGVRIRAIPLLTGKETLDQLIWPNTPGGQVGLTLYGPGAAVFLVGYEFSLTLGP